MPTKKSTVISVRLNPAIKEDRQAIEIIEALKKRGFTTRSIITDAILKAAGHTPEMYHDSQDTVTRPILENLLSDFAQEIVEAIRHDIPESKNTKPSPFDSEDTDENYARNLAQGYLARRKRGRSE
jgi:hypothetical protein